MPASMKSVRLLLGGLLIFALFLRLPHFLTRAREFLQPRTFSFPISQATAKRAELQIANDTSTPLFARIKTKNNRTTSVEERDYVLKNYSSSAPLLDTTIVITSNLIPTHPSLFMINETITSTRERLLGLHPDNTPIIIAVDGLKPDASENDRLRYQSMVEFLRSN